MALIRSATELFDRVIVAVGVNPLKKGRRLFTLEESAKMLRQSLDEAGLDNVEVRTFADRLLVNFAFVVGATHIVRGIRSATDYFEEFKWFDANYELNPDIATVWIPSPHEHARVSSSFVKGFVGYDGWEDQVRQYLPPAVYPLFVERMRRRLEAAPEPAAFEKLKDTIEELLPETLKSLLPKHLKALLPQKRGGGR
jgi:pantetheine-phosphate adenylyltransferase